MFFLDWDIEAPADANVLYCTRDRAPWPVVVTYINIIKYPSEYVAASLA